MKKGIKTILCGMLLFFSFLFFESCYHCKYHLTEQRRMTIEKEILEINAEIVRTAETMDADALFDFILDTDKGSLIQNGNLLLTRKDAYESYTRNIQGIQSIGYEFEEQHITVLSPKIALLTAKGRSDVQLKDGRSFGSPFAQTLVFVLENGKWKVLHTHQSASVRR